MLPLASLLPAARAPQHNTSSLTHSCPDLLSRVEHRADGRQVFTCTGVSQDTPKTSWLGTYRIGPALTGGARSSS
jgi:hypothetical protein